MAISDANANILEQRSFDAWEGGALRKYPVGIFSERASLPRGHKLKVGNLLLQTQAEIVNYILQNGLILDRGYTGHEHLFAVGIIHMNGRLYDPALKRFLSPDNFVQDPFNTQNFNRYGYVLNNPLIYTDPSGEIIFGIIAVAILAGSGKVGLAATIGLIVGAAVLDRMVGNAIAGNPLHWGIGKTAVFSTLTALASAGIGSINFGKADWLFRAGMHGLAGGAISSLAEGSIDGFLPGFAAGFVSSLASDGLKALGTERIGGLKIRSNLARNHEGLYKAIVIAGGALGGGLSAEIAGGNGWQGATQGAIVAGLNHLHAGGGGGDRAKRKKESLAQQRQRTAKTVKSVRKLAGEKVTLGQEWYSNNSDKISGILDAFAVSNDAKVAIMGLAKGDFTDFTRIYFKSFKIAGVGAGRISALISWNKYITAPTTENLLRATMDTSALSLGPWTSASLSVLDVTGATDHFYENLGSMIDTSCQCNAGLEVYNLSSQSINNILD